MVDILRGYEPAVEWLGSLEEAPGLPGFVVLELMNDEPRNKQEMVRLQDELDVFAIHWPGEADCNRAVEHFAHARLSHGVGPFDSLIAQCAVGLSASLCTFNVKHFATVRDLTVEQPYAKPTPPTSP